MTPLTLVKSEERAKHIMQGSFSEIEICSYHIYTDYNYCSDYKLSIKLYFSSRVVNERIYFVAIVIVEISGFY